MQRLSIHDYKIGIICALPRERTAVEAMLDDVHERHSAIERDNNNYTFGRIAQHNVVIASLGIVYGTVAAAGVVNDIRRSLHVQYCLMVGIAGAMPRPDCKEADVRLGDIVVGCGSPAVVNYRLGKKADEGFDIRSELPQPPDALAKTVKALETQHQLCGPTYLRHLYDMLTKHARFNRPEILEDYYNMPVEQDLLHRTVYDNEEVANDRLRRQKSFNIVHRTPRDLRQPPEGMPAARFVRVDGNRLDYPKVFYGTVASADALMKDAAARDTAYERIKAQKKVDILCFEMEAAGIDWPCLVIRGICDYCDEHKNDDWQNFAAATAAAYAKDLLIWLPGAVRSDSVETYRSNISCPVSWPTQVASTTAADLNVLVLLHSTLQSLVNGRSSTNIEARIAHLVDVIANNSQQAIASPTSASSIATLAHSAMTMATVTRNINAESTTRAVDVQFESILRMASDNTLVAPQDALKRRLALCRRQVTFVGCILAGVARSSILRRVAMSKATTLLVVQGSGPFRHHTNVLGTLMIQHIQNCGVPVLWVLQPAVAHQTRLSLSWMQILRYLANQALDINSTQQQPTCQPQRAAVTEQDWLEILKHALTGLHQVYIIIDLEVVDGELLKPASLPALLQSMHRLVEGAADSTGLILKIVVLNPRRTVRLILPGAAVLNVAAHARRAEAAPSNLRLTSKKVLRFPVSHDHRTVARRLE